MTRILPLVPAISVPVISLLFCSIMYSACTSLIIMFTLWLDHAHAVVAFKSARV